MSRVENKNKREKALHKMGNQITVLKNTGTKKQQRTIKQIEELYQSLV